MARVQLEHVTKRYDDQCDVVTAVDDMNLDIDHGEFVCSSARRGAASRRRWR